MKTARLVFALTLAALFALSLAARGSSCIQCHGSLPGNFGAVVAQWKASIHNEAGVSCVDCHGGDNTAASPAAAMDPRKGFKGAPSPLDIPKLCGGCHADKTFMKKFNPSIRVDQLELYWTSKHGQLIEKGDGHAATCVSCHGAHKILKPGNPLSPVYPTHVADTCGKCHADKALMDRYHLSSDVVAQYRKSVHAKALYVKGDLSAPTCNDCHGNHGAIPPNLKSISFVCGTCHVINQQLYDAGPMKEPWEVLKYGQCIVCHGKHNIQHPSDALLDPAGNKSACKQCHDKGSKGYQVMAGMYQNIHSLDQAISHAETDVDKASSKGMLMDDASLLLQEAHSSLMKSRVHIHTFNVSKVSAITGKGMKDAKKADTLAQKAFRELQFRRKGLAVFFGLAALVALLLWLKLRQMEKPKEP